MTALRCEIFQVQADSDRHAGLFDAGRGDHIAVCARRGIAFFAVFQLHGDSPKIRGDPELDVAMFESPTAAPAVCPLTAGVALDDDTASLLCQVWRLVTNFLFFGLFGLDYVFHMFFL